MKTFFKIILLSVIFASCEDVETAIYEGAESDQTFLSFSSTVYSLPVIEDATGSIEVVLNSSAISSVDRTYTINVVLAETFADPTTYNVPTSVTIPAGRHQGFFTITGQDNNLVDVLSKQVVITFEPLSDLEMLDTNKATINVFQVCPFEEGFFEGEYLMTEIAGNSAQGPAFNTQVVDIVWTSEYTRKFRAIYLESVLQGPGSASDFSFTLACETVMLSGTVETPVSCDPAEDPTFVNVSPGLTPGAYNELDDTTFTLTIREFATNSGLCNGTESNTIIQFTKI